MPSREQLEKEYSDLMDYQFTFEALDACPLCDGKVMLPNGHIAWHQVNFWYVVCPGCGLKFMNPRPDRESYVVFYKQYFWQQKIRNVGYVKKGQMQNAKLTKWDNDDLWEPEEGRRNKIEKIREKRVKSMVPILQDYKNLDSETDVLEVGCAFGVTLNELKKQFGCQVAGIEPSEEAVQTCRSYGIDMIGSFAEDLERLQNQPRKFDFILFSHVLENTTDPMAVLRWTRACLKPDGMIYIQTPNLLTFDQMNPYHPYLFSRHTLALLVEQTGMTCDILSPSIDKMLTVMCKNQG